MPDGHQTTLNEYLHRHSERVERIQKMWFEWYQQKK
jgi:hypothetical protein